MCQDSPHSLILVCQDIASVLLLLCVRHLNPSAGVKRAHACHQKPYTLSAETHEGFAGNPIPFRQKPYTLLRGGRYLTAVDRGAAGQSVECIRALTIG